MTRKMKKIISIEIIKSLQPNEQKDYPSDAHSFKLPFSRSFLEYMPKLFFTAKL
jgi:hypothetical protein